MRSLGFILEFGVHLIFVESYMSAIYSSSFSFPRYFYEIGPSGAAYAVAKKSSPVPLDASFSTQ